MGLLDALDEVPENHGGVKSQVDAWLESLSDEDRADAESVLRNRSVGHARLSKLIEKVYGRRIASENIGHYRRTRLSWDG